MEGLSSYVRIALTVALLQLLSGCQLQHDLSLRFDVSKLDKSQITDFKYSSHEEVQYYRNVVLGTSIKSLDLVYSNCSNDKILMTDRYVYFIENPSSASALEYQLKINLCGGAAIRPTKTWKISYSDIKKIEKYGARYKIYFQSESSPVEILFFKTYMYDGKAVEEVMKEMGNLEVSGMIDMSEIYDGGGGGHHIIVPGYQMSGKNGNHKVQRLKIFLAGISFIHKSDRHSGKKVFALRNPEYGVRME